MINQRSPIKCLDTWCEMEHTIRKPFRSMGRWPLQIYKAIPIIGLELNCFKPRPHDSAILNSQFSWRRKILLLTRYQRISMDGTKRLSTSNSRSLFTRHHGQKHPSQQQKCKHKNVIPQHEFDWRREHAWDSKSTDTGPEIAHQKRTHRTRRRNGPQLEGPQIRFTQ